MNEVDKKKLIATIERTNSAIDLLRLKPQILAALKPKKAEKAEKGD